MKIHGPGLSLIAGLVWGGALLGFSGWAFSFFGILGPGAYGGVLVVFAGAAFFFLKNQPWLLFSRKILARLHHPLPAVFAGSIVLVLLGALLYPPSNYDALTYRIPRIMHWLSQGGWFWIPTANDRQNYSGTGQEWLLAPLLALTGTDRFLFLPNFISFVFLPSVFFRIFRGLGFSGRMAVVWMWIFPLAPVYLLQAGGMANDLLGSFWFLASLALLPGRTLIGGRPGASLLSLALCTAVKASNLVLLLPWFLRFVAEVFRRRDLWRPTLAILPLACVVSFAPIAYLNDRHTGDWSGDPLNQGAMKSTQPWLAITGNGLLVTAVNLQQPVNFGAHHVLEALGSLVPQKPKEVLLHAYPRWSLPKDEFAIEENAAWGWPIVLLLLGALVAGANLRRRAGGYLGLAGLICAAVMMGKLASEAMPRLLAPLYPLLMLPLIGDKTKNGPLFRAAVFGAVVMFVAPLLLAPSRPLLPWKLISRGIEALDPNSFWPKRITQVEQAYRQRAEGLRPLIPAELEHRSLRILLLSNGNDTEGPLWWPYGKRKIESRRLADPLPLAPPDLVLIREKEWPLWSSQWGIEAQTRKKVSLALLAREGPEVWLCLQPETWPGSP